MKNTYTYTIISIILSLPTLVWASDIGDKKGTADHTEHPPHTHHRTDYIKKIDQSARRRTREDEEETHQ